jgi:cytochrome c-type biogenesis protein
MALGGAVLIAMGVLVFTGELFRLNVEAQRFLDGIGINFFNEV